MDNSAQGVAPAPNPTASQQPVPTVSYAQPVAPTAPAAQAPVPQVAPEMLTDTVQMGQQPVPPPPVQPVSLPHREAGPGLGRMAEFVQPTNMEPVLAPEVKEAGVEVAPDIEQPQVPIAAAQAGLQVAKAAVPVQASTGSAVEYLTDAPITEIEAIKIEKSKGARESIRWLATFLLRQIKKIKLLGK